MTRPEIGILGGSFDPPHVGHVLASMNAMIGCGLSRVLWVPVRAHPFGKESSPYPTRVQMAVETVLDIDAIDVVWSFEKDFPNTALEQTRYIRKLYPTAILDWIIGSDIATELELWAGSRELREITRFIVIKRDEEREVYPEGFDVRYLPVGVSRCSSTSIRAKCSTGAPIDGLVHPTVLDTIRFKELYKKKQ